MTKYTTLKRLSNGATLNISKPVFRIGKAHGRVDFCLAENRTVNSVHSTIYTLTGS
jgi:hypothetical protein